MRHRVLFQNPGPAVPDGDGGYTQSWIDLVPPTWQVSIEPATAAATRAGRGGHGDHVGVAYRDAATFIRT